MTPAILLLAFVTLQRLGELWLAQRNTRALMQKGAVESGQAHYPLIVGLHAAWLAGLWLMAWDDGLDLRWLGAFAVLQVLRAWVIATLGPRWTTRIITVPGETLVRRGPYRFISHPNYAVVALEMAVLPLVFGLWAYALMFFVLNASVLWVRIKAENEALAAPAPQVTGAR